MYLNLLDPCWYLHDNLHFIVVLIIMHIRMYLNLLDPCWYLHDNLHFIVVLIIMQNGHSQV